MANVNVLNQNGEVVRNLELNDSVWAIEPNQQAMFDAVMVYRASTRQATAKTKTRSEVRGGGKKPWRQKGTGRARQGSIRAPQWRGGGVVFGPTGEQNYSIKMNKKVRTLALKSALSFKNGENAVKVVDQFTFEEYKTKAMIASLEKLNANGKTLVVVTEDSANEQAWLSSWNIPNVLFVYSWEFNVYDVLNCETLIVTENALKDIEEVLING